MTQGDNGDLGTAARREVGAVIVNYRTPQLSLDAVRSVLAEPEIAALVLVDSGSGDDSVAVLQQAIGDDPNVTLLALDANVGFGVASNLGARQLDQPYLLLLNSDATLEPGALGALLGELDRAPDIGAVAPLVLGPDERTPQVDAYGSFVTLRVLVTRTNRRPMDALEPDWVSGVALLLPRQAWDEVDGFDPSFVMYHEDVDLCLRLRRSGYTVRRVPGARVVHLGGGSKPSTAARDRSYHDSLFLYLQRAGYPKWQLAALAPVHRTWQWAMRAAGRGGRGAAPAATRRPGQPGSGGHSQ